MDKEKLILDEMDKKISSLRSVDDLVIPSSGWIYAIRKSIKMSLKQLGKRMGISAQSVQEIEQREKNGAISLNVLKSTAQALDMRLIYGFIPREKSLKRMIEKRAAELAHEIVMRTSVQMKLEDQELSRENIEISIQEKTMEIMQILPKYLWD